MRTEILYEDNSILVIRKPAGLAVQSARIGQADVVSELKSYLAKQAGAGQGEPYLAVIHRLDQPERENSRISGWYTGWISRWRVCWYSPKRKSRQQF